MESNHTVVIGGGIAGLASAALLAKNGFKVTLLEKNSQLGGRASVYRKNGFVFDMGPSWYMMPEVFEKFFRFFNQKTTDYYQLIKLNPRYRVFLPNQNPVDLKTDLSQNKEVFESLEKGAGQKLESYLKVNQEIYNLAGGKLVYDDFSQLKNYLKTDSWLAFLKIITLFNPLQNLHRYLKKYFQSQSILKILEFPSVFLGGSPYNTPALYSLMNWADFGKKIWYPKGGMNQLVNALENLCRNLGVKIMLNEEAISIKTKNNQANQVLTNQNNYFTNLVIINADYPFAETKLLSPADQSYPEKYWQKKTPAISALIIYLGIKRRLKNVIHHNLYFGLNWKKNFQQIFDKPALPEDPSYYVSVRSFTDRTIVPKNCEELFFLIPLSPRVDKQKNTLEKYAQKVIKHFEKITGNKITKDIVVKKIFGPEDFENCYNAYQGTALGLAHTLNQSLFLRPSNKSKKVKNLYYAGHYTQPGVGVPMVLISAQITIKRILNERGISPANF